MYKENNGERFPTGRAAVIDMAVEAIDATFSAMMASLEVATNTPALTSAFSPMAHPENSKANEDFDHIIASGYKEDELTYLRYLAEKSAVSSEDMTHQREGVQL